MCIETHSAVSPQPQCLRKKIRKLKSWLGCLTKLAIAVFRIQLKFNYNLIFTERIYHIQDIFNS